MVENKFTLYAPDDADAVAPMYGANGENSGSVGAISGTFVPCFCAYCMAFAIVPLNWISVELGVLGGVVGAVVLVGGVPFAVLFAVLGDGAVVFACVVFLTALWVVWLAG